MNNKLVIITESVESTLREEDFEAAIIVRQVILKRGVDKMSKTHQAKTKEQVNRVQTTFETVMQKSARNADTRSGNNSDLRCFDQCNSCHRC